MGKEIIPFELEPAGISRYSAFDALASVNPEIAAITYANRAGILQPEVMPLIANFRTCQRDERIAALGAIVEHARIGADERMNLVINRTKERITGLQETGKIRRIELREAGATARTALHETGLTRRTELECSAAMLISRLKYETDVQIVREQSSTRRYISDNQLKATYIEATALRDSIIATERFRAITKMKESGDRLAEAIRKSEMDYLARIKEAEELRARDYEKDASGVVEAYLMVQAQTHRNMLRYQLHLARLRLGETKATYEGTAQIAGYLTDVLKARPNTKSASLTAKTLAGDIQVRIDLEDGNK